MMQNLHIALFAARRSNSALWRTCRTAIAVVGGFVAAAEVGTVAACGRIAAQNRRAVQVVVRNMVPQMTSTSKDSS